MTFFSSRIRELRHEVDVTQKALAAGLGISERAYQYYELGAREPSISTLIALANYFGVSVDYLLGLSDVKERR